MALRTLLAWGDSGLSPARAGHLQMDIFLAVWITYHILLSSKFNGSMGSPFGVYATQLLSGFTCAAEMPTAQLLKSHYAQSE